MKDRLKKFREVFASHRKRPVDESPEAWVRRMSDTLRDLEDVAKLPDNRGYQLIEMQIVEAIKQTEEKILRYSRNPVQNERNLIYLSACRDVARGFLTIVESAGERADNLVAVMNEKILRYEEAQQLREASGVNAPEMTPNGLASIGV